VDVAPLPRNDYDFALSPDGAKLAVLNDRTVSVYSVPAQSTERTDTLNPEAPAPANPDPATAKTKQ
jgi:hypothetical protein